MQLLNLGRALLIYADTHEDRFPGRLEELRDTVGMADLTWLEQHVTYTGGGLTLRDNTARVLAFDQSLLTKGKGTNVLYLDSHVAFESPPRLEELGIKAER